MIRVLFAFNGTPHLGGTEAVMMSYFRNIDKSRFSIDFLFHGEEADCENDPFCEEIKAGGGKIFFVTERGKDFFKNRSELKEFFASHKYDIVHTHMDASGCFVLSAAKKAGVPLLAAHSHSTDLIMNENSGLRESIKKLILSVSKKETARLARLRIACTGDAGKWLFGSLPFTVINNGIDVKAKGFDAEARKRIRSELGIGSELVVGTIGRLAQVKNHDRMLDIFKALLRIRPDSRLVLVGDGELREHIETRVKNEFPAGTVILTGSRTDTAALNSAFDVYIMTSFFEGLSVSAVEAQAAGLPCVFADSIPSATDMTGLATFISLDRSDSVWAEKIASLAGSERPDMSKKIKAAGFDSEDAVRRLENEYIYHLQEVKSNG